MYGGEGPISRSENGELFHNIGTEQGMSGSPMFVREGGECKAVGIHHGSKKGEKEKLGKELDEQVRAQINNWRSHGTNHIKAKENEAERKKSKELVRAE